MDNDASKPGAPETALPRATPFAAETKRPEAAASPSVAARAVAVAEQNDRTGIFGHLVKDDSDIAGLVAYSIYKQNKLDWLRAFEASKGRPPNDTELDAYIVGEGTARRLSTYRHLAEATLAGNGPGASGAGTRSRTRAFVGDGGALTNGLMLTYGLMAVMFLVILWFASHLVR